MMASQTSLLFSAEEIQRFFLAIKKENVLEVSEYVQQGIMHYMHQSTKLISMCFKLANANWNVLKLMLRGNPIIINDPSLFVMQQHVSEPDHLRFLLEVGGSANIVVKSSSRIEEPILIYALKKRVPSECVKLLVSRGANVNTRCAENQVTPLMLACKHLGSEKQAKYLISAGADVDAVDRDRQSALIHAVKNKLYGVVIKRLLAASANPNLRDGNGSTALIYAAMNKVSCVTFKALLVAGADPNVVDHSGRTALLEAMRWPGNERAHVIRILLESGADPDFPPAQNPSNFASSLMGSQGLEINLLVKKFKDYQSKIKVYETSVDKAVKEVKSSDKLSMVKILMSRNKRNQTIDSRDLNNSLLSALLLKSYPEKESLVQLLLENGAETNVTDESGRTPLILAAYSCANLKIFELLIQANCDAAAQDATKRTALHYLAAFQTLLFPEQVAILKLLLKSGANPNTTDFDGRTPLMLCADQNCSDIKVYKLLIEAGTDLSIQDNNLNTVLHHNKTHRIAKEVITSFVNKDNLNILTLKNTANTSPIELFVMSCIKNCDVPNLKYIMNIACSNFTDQQLLVFSSECQEVIHNSCDNLSDILEKCELLDIIYNSSLPNLVDPAYCFTTYFPMTFFCKNFLRQFECDFNWLGRFLLKLKLRQVHEFGKRDCKTINWFECVKKLTSYGYEVPSNSSCVSPLTVIMNIITDSLALVTRSQENQAILMEIAQYFIDKGASVTETKFVFEEEYVTDIMREFPIPDSLWLAAMSGDADCLRLLLPFWPHPPLALLIYTLPAEYSTLWAGRPKVSLLYPILAAGGPLPVGSQIYKQVLKLIENKEAVPAKIRAHFKAMHHCNGGVPSLLSLCRVAVRSHLPAGADLPQRIYDLLPYCGVEEVMQLDLTDSDKIVQQLNDMQVDEVDPSSSDTGDESMSQDEDRSSSVLLDLEDFMSDMEEVEEEEEEDVSDNDYASALDGCSIC